MDEFGLNEAYTPELREKMARLEKENEILKRRVDSGVAESVSESPLGKGRHNYVFNLHPIVTCTGLNCAHMCMCICLYGTVVR